VTKRKLEGVKDIGESGNLFETRKPWELSLNFDTVRIGKRGSLGKGLDKSNSEVTILWGVLSQGGWAIIDGNVGSCRKITSSFKKR